MKKEKIYRLNVKYWNIPRVMYLIGGLFVFASSLLALLVSVYWIFFTMFVGLMFVNFAITGYCPTAILADKIGIKRK